MMLKKIRLLIAGVMMVSVIGLTGCNKNSSESSSSSEPVVSIAQTTEPATTTTTTVTPTTTEPVSTKVSDFSPIYPNTPATDNPVSNFTFSVDGIVFTIPEYSGLPYVNISPEGADMVTNLGGSYNPETGRYESFEHYSDLDALGRCGEARAVIGVDLQPNDKRGEIGNVKPSGWTYNGKSNNNKYDFVDGKYIYNRCHLIGYQLTGENDNEKNLITGTRQLNIDGMLWLENECDDYLEAEINKYNHILYRVIPIFKDNELICRGLFIRAYSLEDEGAGVDECIFAYNAQENVEINYKTGENHLKNDNKPTEPDIVVKSTYILNTNSHKYHKDENCSGVQSMSKKNKQYFEGTEAELIQKGYEPCKICFPSENETK